MSRAGKIAVLVFLGLGGACALALREQHDDGAVAEAVASAGPSASAMPAASAAGPRLVELGSNSCRSCKAMHEELALFRAECGPSIAVEEIDVWKDEAAAERYGIRTIPTQVFLDEQGRELGRHMGFISREAIKSKFALAGVECKP